MSSPESVAVFADALSRLVRREELPHEVAARVLTTILSGEASDAQIAAFAVLLRAKGETATELAALVRTMLEFAARVPVETSGNLVDTCGTGGDRSGTVNVSTMAAFVVAGAGVKVAKNGNRAASSQSGSADVLEALGVAIDLPPAGVARCIAEAGIGFCFAPRFHPALRHAATARRDLGVPTTFNFLGPLANPARVRHQAIGVSDAKMAERLVGTLAELGSIHALVFYGHDGLDELTTTAPSTVFELRDGAIRTFDLDPESLGLPRADAAALIGGDAAHNAAVARRVLDGERGPVRDIVVLNAAAALVAAEAVTDLADGVGRAEAALDDGGAATVLERFVAVSRAAAEAGP